MQAVADVVGQQLSVLHGSNNQEINAVAGPSIQHDGDLVRERDPLCDHVVGNNCRG